MTPLPLVPIVLVIVGLTAFAACCVRALPVRRAVIVGAAIGLACGIVLPPIGVGYIEVVSGSRALRVLMTMANVGGVVTLITAPLAVPCGIGAALLGRWTTRVLAPRGDSGEAHSAGCESLQDQIPRRGPTGEKVTASPGPHLTYPRPR